MTSKRCMCCHIYLHESCAYFKSVLFIFGFIRLCKVWKMNERIYKDERGLLLDDEAASMRDAMYDQAEFIERELEQMTGQIKSIIQAVNTNHVGLWRTRGN